LSFRIEVSDRASAQIRVAARWWVDNRSKAPGAFAEEVERAFELLSVLPSTGEPVLHPRLYGLRRIFLARVRYHLYYTVSPEAEAVEVLSLWHASRGSTPVL